MFTRWRGMIMKHPDAFRAGQQSSLLGLRGLDKQHQVTVAAPTVRATACLESIKSGGGGPRRACQRSRRLDAGGGLGGPSAAKVGHIYEEVEGLHLVNTLPVSRRIQSSCATPVQKTTDGGKRVRRRPGKKKANEG